MKKAEKTGKRKFWPFVTAAVLLALLFVPVPAGTMNDGGSRDYRAAAYRVVHWKRLMPGTTETETDIHENTCVYWFPDNWKSIDELWELRH